MEFGKLDVDSFLQTLAPGKEGAKKPGSAAKQAPKRENSSEVVESTKKKSKQGGEPKKKQKKVVEEVVEEVDDEVEDEVDEEELHRQQLQALAVSDPEFYKTLQEEGQDLLAFGDDDEMEESHQAEEDSGEDDNDDQEEEEKDSIPLLTLQEIQKLEKKAIKGDVVSIRRLIRGFRHTMMQPFELSKDEHAYEHLLMHSLIVISRGLDLALGVTKAQPKANLKNSPLAHPIKQLLVCLTKLISSKHTSPHVLKHLLQHSRMFVNLFSQNFAAVEGKRFLQLLVVLWSKEDSEGPIRLACFFRIRQMSMADPSFLELALRECYVAFARHAKSFKIESVRERIGLQAHCLVELYGLNKEASYRIGFLHIRQLALHVRSALASKTAESLQSICSWQFMHCLRVWAFILVQHEKLKELVFPFLQVSLGVLSLFQHSNSTRYLPLQLHCLDLVNRVSSKHKLFTPVGLLCVELLRNLVAKKIVSSTETMVAQELESLLKFKADASQHANVRLLVIPQIVDLLRAHLVVNRSSVAFPELFLQIREQLTAIPLRSMKKGDAWVVSAIKSRDALIKDADGWVKVIKEQRQNLSGPGDVEACELFRQKFEAQFEEEEKKKKKSNADQLAAAVLPLFKVGKEVVLVEPKLTKEVEFNRKDDDDEEEEESVAKLNPKDFDF